MWQQIQDYHQRRHWHQLTTLMLEIVVRPELQSGEQLHELYSQLEVLQHPGGSDPS